MAEVLFNAGNVLRCLCPSCPVQTTSQCVKEQMSGLREALKRNPLKAEAMPVLYCASGVAFCGDINFKKACICASCPIYVDYKLRSAKPLLFYCRDGTPK